MISWSQVETWIGKRGFNTGLPGFHEYMRKYFMGETYPDMGWGQYGSEMESYITLRNAPKEVIDALDANDRTNYEECMRNFTKEEKEFLSQIEPLGNYQTEIIIDFGDFILLGYMDDHTDDFLHLRDYKSKSASTRLSLSKPDNYQLDVYALYCHKELGILPQRAEYLVVERLGGGECMRGEGRKALKVGKNIWSIDREISIPRLEETESIIRETAYDIANYWKTFQKFNKE
jgi:hypothetical protein